jgi:nucleoside-diphosphate-sugar epimerase
MNKPTIMVTGAGGFLGCRLVECLLAQGKYKVRAMAHRPAGAVRLVRLPVDVIWCDITKAEQVDACMKGVDFVVHCAYGTSILAAEARAATIAGTRNLAAAAAAHDVRQFIHISTIAVHSYMPKPGVTEESPFGKASDTYCKEKIAAERVIQKSMYGQDLPATILRMGNIYGPFSGPWTIRQLMHLANGFETLVGDGSGASNMVYVDNAVEAILRSIGNSKAIGETFFIVDDEVSWRDHFQEYASWMAGVELRSVSREKFNQLLQVSAIGRVGAWFGDVWKSVLMPSLRDAAFHVAESKSVGKLASSIWSTVPVSFKEKFLGDRGLTLPYVVLGIESAPENKPKTAVGLLQVYASQAAISNKKAKRILGWGPSLNFDKAMANTREWAQWARLTSK